MCIHLASTFSGQPKAATLAQVLFPVRHSQLACTCNISCLQKKFQSEEMSKNIEIVCAIIFRVLYLADPGPDDRPQYYCQSGTVTRHPPAIFLFFHKFLNW